MKHQQMTEAVTALMAYAPFFSSLYYDKMKLAYADYIPTLATDGYRLLVNREYFDTLTVQERVFALCHEIGHAMFMHIPRSKFYKDAGFDGRDFSPFIWNVAGDLVINPTLISAKIGRIKEGWLLDKKYNDTWLVDDVYRDLLKRYPPPPQSSQAGSGEGSGSGEDGDGGGEGGGEAGENDETPVTAREKAVAEGVGIPHDTHITSGETPAQASDEEGWKQAVAAAAANAKAIGNLPGSLERFVEQFLEPQITWKEKLRHAVNNAISYESTSWRKVNRRAMHQYSIVLPGHTGYGAGVVVVAVDTSGSIGTDELAAFAGEMQSILTDTVPERLIAMPCDARVYDEAELTTAGDLEHFFQHKLKGGGGTSFVPVFEWLDEENIRPDALIYLTDMYGSFPESPPPYPVIWVSTTDVSEAPFGEVLNITI